MIEDWFLISFKHARTKREWRAVDDAEMVVPNAGTRAEDDDDQ